MSGYPPSKGLKPVTSVKMLNFVYWLSTRYPDMCNTRFLSNETMLQVIREFEQERQDLESNAEISWRNSVDNMLRGDRYYDNSRKVLNGYKQF